MTDSLSFCLVFATVGSFFLAIYGRVSCRHAFSTPREIPKKEILTAGAVNETVVFVSVCSKCGKYSIKEVK